MVPIQQFVKLVGFVVKLVLKLSQPALGLLIFVDVFLTAEGIALEETSQVLFEIFSMFLFAFTACSLASSAGCFSSTASFHK